MHLLERIGQAKFITTIDLSKGYWQILKAPKDCANTAFGTPWGLYKFLCMRFWLNRAVATFQRLMDSLLAPHTAYATTYINDFTVFTKTWHQFVQAVKTILEEIRNTGMTANPKKCVLAGKETKYLGFLVGQGISRLLTDKI